MEQYKENAARYMVQQLLADDKLQDIIIDAKKVTNIPLLDTCTSIGELLFFSLSAYPKHKELIMYNIYGLLEFIKKEGI